jgi:thiol-disulfide isomerase/thioredoxin
MSDDTAQPTPATPPPTARIGGTSRTLLIGIAVVAAAIGAAGLLTGGTEPTSAPVPSGSGESAFGLADAVAELPDFPLEGFADQPGVAAADLLGGAPLIVNFWATWCAPCVAEMPDLQRLHVAGGGSFRLVGINYQDAAINAEPFVEDLGITYDLFTDRSGEYLALVGGFGMPTTLFVEPDGRVAYRHTGPLTLEQMEELLDEHLGVAVQA